jgi:pimeloyl-ACP methyl ester carboxylesterase
MHASDPDLARGKFVEFAHPAGTVRAHYHEVGSGTQVVMLVQSGGAGSSAYMTWYRNLVPLADAGYHIFAPDMIGFALSELVDQPGKRINSSEFLAGFMDAVRVPRAHFMGNSMGSNAISRLATDDPARVRSLIFTGGEPRVDSDETRAISRELGKTARVDFVRQMFARPEVDFADMRHATVAFFYDGEHPAVDEVATMRLEAVRRPGVHEREREAAQGQIARGRETFESSNLAQIQAPTYLIHGRDERNFYAPDIAPALLEAAIRAAFVIPDCSATILSHCGHWPQIEQADVFNALALEFIRRAP